MAVQLRNKSYTKKATQSLTENTKMYTIYSNKNDESDMNLESSVILNQVPSFIFWKDLNSVFLGCNNAFAHSAGLASPNDIIGKTDFDLIWGDTCAELYQKSDRKVLDGEIQTVFLETQVK